MRDIIRIYPPPLSLYLSCPTHWNHTYTNQTALCNMNDLWPLTSPCDLSTSPSSELTRSRATLSFSLTFSSRALWCSKRDFRAFKTSTSDDTPAGDDAWRLTTVILSERSWRDTRHSRCSSSNCSENIKQSKVLKASSGDLQFNVQCLHVCSHLQVTHQIMKKINKRDSNQAN